MIFNTFEHKQLIYTFNTIKMSHNHSESNYRNLLDEEIGQLVYQGCSSTDWNLVKVSGDFIPDNIENCKFTGHILLNSFTGSVNLVGGIAFNTGI